MKRSLILVFTLVCYFTAMAQLPPMPVRPSVNLALAPFYHGVASGDPLSDRVIIWTRVTPTVAAPISVDWQVATDTLFTSVVNSGTFITDSTRDYTVKVDVTGLSANTWYYYRFKNGSVYSICGRTKTLPLGNTDSVRLAVFSCSSFEAGYFNVYNEISKRNDISAIVHLGDNYYEYGAGGTGDTSRFHPLTHDASTLGDYRLWQSQYKLDNDYRAVLEQYPMIMVWDDHESANNSWYSSAQNHNPATQGNWFTRKNFSKKAYFEWNPIRSIATGNDSIIHRNFNFGNLFNLVMVDTRLEGRDSTLGSLISPTNAYMTSSTRQLLGTTQLNWLKSQLSDTSTKWKIIGNQVMIAPILLFGSVLNGDQWDGYPAERDRVLDHIHQNNIKDVVVLTGDIHSSWANDVPGADSTYVSATGAGSVATEFVVSSVTSSAVSIPGGPAAMMTTNPWVKYLDLAKRGYLLLDINKTRTQGDYIHFSTVSSTTYTTTVGAKWQNLDGERHLRIAPSPLGPNPGNPPLVSPFPIGTSSVAPIKTNTGLLVFSCYPNPSYNEVIVQYHIAEASKIGINLTDISGKVVYNSITTATVQGLNISSIDVSGLPAGVYMLTLYSESGTYSQKIIKEN